MKELKPLEEGVIHLITTSKTALTLEGATYSNGDPGTWAIRFGESLVISEGKTGKELGHVDTFSGSFQDFHLIAELLEANIVKIIAKPDEFSIVTPTRILRSRWTPATKSAVQVDFGSSTGAKWSMVLPDDL